MSADVSLGEALGTIGIALGIHPSEFTRLDARARNMLRDYPGQKGWERLLVLGATQGQTALLTPRDVLTLCLALKLNLASINPSAAIPAVKRAMAEPVGGAVAITIPAALGSGSLTLDVEVPAFWREHHVTA
jgi:hypothetical protein